MRITKDPEIRRKEIIDTAKKLFESKGIKKTSMNDIAENAGIAKGLLYYYFSSKEELVEAVVDEFVTGVDEELKTIVNNNTDFFMKLTGLLDFYFNSIQGHPLMLSYSPGEPEISALIRDRLSEVALVYGRGLIAMGTELGLVSIRYPEYMLKVIIRGLGDLYIEGITDPNIHSTLIEQMLGLKAGALQFGNSFN
jgi:AcrR family transcriptional regulator